MKEMDLDPSLAFTAQLDHAPGLTSEEGETWRAGLLTAWYAQEETRNFWDFAREYAPANRAWEARRAACPEGDPKAEFLAGWRAAMDQAAEAITRRT